VKSRWQLQEAKAQLSQVVQQAREGTPQVITLRGEPAAVVLSSAAYEALQSRRQGLVDWLARPILDNDGLFRRSRETGRELTL
jgi:prevent-host-death family protein